MMYLPMLPDELTRTAILILLAVYCER